jgi:hypothetical protein
MTQQKLEMLAATGLQSAGTFGLMLSTIPTAQLQIYLVVRSNIGL